MIRVWILAVARNVSGEESETREMGMLSSLQGCDENSCDKEKLLKLPCVGLLRLRAGKGRAAWRSPVRSLLFRLPDKPC